MDHYTWLGVPLSMRRWTEFISSVKYFIPSKENMHPIIYERVTQQCTYVFLMVDYKVFKDVFHLFLTNIMKNILETAIGLLAKE